MLRAELTLILVTKESGPALPAISAALYANFTQGWAIRLGRSSGRCTGTPAAQSGASRCSTHRHTQVTALPRRASSHLVRARSSQLRGQIDAMYVVLTATPLHPPTRRPILPCRNGKSLVAHFALHCDGDPEPVELSLAEVCAGAGCQRRWSDVRVCDVHAQPVFGGRALELAASRSKSVVRKGGAVWPLTAALYSDVSRWPAFVARRPNFHAWLDYHAAQGVGCFFVYEVRDAPRLSRLRASSAGGDGLTPLLVRARRVRRAPSCSASGRPALVVAVQSRSRGGSSRGAEASASWRCQRTLSLRR